MVAEDNFGILWDSLNFWESKCFRSIHKCSFESLSPKVLKDISFLFILVNGLGIAKTVTVTGVSLFSKTSLFNDT